MVAGYGPALAMSTGAKRGMTQPPGNTTYNVSKAGVKALTESLAYSLRDWAGDRMARTC